MKMAPPGRHKKKTAKPFFAGLGNLITHNGLLDILIISGLWIRILVCTSETICSKGEWVKTVKNAPKGEKCRLYTI